MGVVAAIAFFGQVGPTQPYVVTAVATGQSQRLCSVSVSESSAGFISGRLLRSYPPLYSIALYTVLYLYLYLCGPQGFIILAPLPPITGAGVAVEHRY